MIQTYDVTSTGTYDITVAGAQGGTYYGLTGGLGAVLSGDVSLTAAQAGAGGGTFVYVSDASQPLIVAGGAARQ